MDMLAKILKRSTALLLTLLLTGTLPVLGNGSSQKKLLILGDSIATGYSLPGYDSSGDPKAASSWSTLLAERYSAKQYNRAVDGDRTSDLLEEIAKPGNQTLIGSADVICLSIGGNNFLHLLTSYSDNLFAIAELDSDAEEMLEAASSDLDAIFSGIRQTNSNAPVLVQTLYNPYQYWNISIFGSDTLGEWFGSYIDRYNAILKEKINAYGFVCIEVAEKFKNEGQKSWLYTSIDNATPSEITAALSNADPHPTVEGHRAIYETYVETADELLSKALSVSTAETTADSVNTAPEITTPETTMPPVITDLLTTSPATDPKATVSEADSGETSETEPSDASITSDTSDMAEPSSDSETKAEITDSESSADSASDSSSPSQTSEKSDTDVTNDSKPWFFIILILLAGILTGSVIFLRKRKQKR